MAAEKKRGGNSSPAIFMKRMTAALSGVALGVVSCFTMYDPVPVYADFGNLVDSVDYIEAAFGTEAAELNESPVAGWILLLYALQQFYTDYQIDIASDASQFSEISGTYINSAGEEKFCSVFVYPSWTNPSNSIVAKRLVALADDFALVASIPVSARFETSYVTSNNNYFVYIGGSGSDNNISSTGTTVLPGTIYQSSGWPQYGTYILISDKPVNLDGVALSTRLASNYYANRPLIKGDVGTKYALPSGEMSLSDLNAYIDGDFREYVVEYYPEYIFLLPEPQPEPPQYDTEDIVPGIPKDWTIINPELPTSPHLDLTIPEGDFQAIDPGDTFTGFASGVGFWWSMVNEILTTFHIKTLALALLAVAVAIFALYKIGG